MHTLTIKLKQHTPLIHFQHDQDGATLRASEVKPKLDKFILTHLGKEDYQTGINLAKDKGWLIGKGDHPALDYKMKIEATNYQDIAIPIRLVKKTDVIGRQLYTTNYYPDSKASLIMSNIGGRAKEELFNLTLANSIDVIIHVKNDALQSKLKENMYLFFARNSFGNRTSKGFGSFEVKSINGIEEEGYLVSDSYVISFTMSLGNHTNKEIVYKDVFKIIHHFWKSLKNISGVKGKAEKNVLLKVIPQRTEDADRIPSPICFKPLIDFYKENGSYFCDVNIATLFNIDVIKCVTGDSQAQYYKRIMTDLKNKLGSNLYSYLSNTTECEIDRQSVNID